MRILAVIILVLTIISPGVSVAEGEKVTFALFSRSWPPFEMVVEGEPFGAAQDIIRQVMPSDVKYSVEPMPAPRKALYQTDGPVYVRMEANEWMERRSDCLWSAPVMELGSYLYSPVGAPIEYTGPESLEGKVIGCIKNYTYPAVQALFESGKAQRYDVNSDQVLLRMLKAGRIDAIVMDSIVVDWVIRKTPGVEQSDFHAASQPVDVVDLRLVFSRNPGWEQRLSEVNDLIEKKRRDGTLDRIMSSYR